MELENKIDYKEIWNAICYTMENNKFENEATLQILLENSILQRLGWEMSKGEIQRPIIKYGSSNFIKPDAVLCRDDNNLLVIELKKVFAKITENNEQQLFSYMRELKLRFGILWGKNICVYYDDILDKEQPQKVCEIFFDKDNENGIELIKLLYKRNFKEIDFENYCLTCIKKITLLKENNQKIKFLCSENGVEYIKQLLLTEYNLEIINSIEIKVLNKNKEVEKYTNINNSKNTVKKNFTGSISVNTSNLEIMEGETLQNWLKRILLYLSLNNYLSEDEIERLHSKDYSRQMFGIPFSLLCDSKEEAIINGHWRYWANFRLNNKYYVCSQFTNTQPFINNFKGWLNKVLAEKN